MNKNLIALAWIAAAFAGGYSLVVHIRESNRRHKLEQLELEVRRTMSTKEWQELPFVERMEYLFNAKHRVEQI